jgi:hypothetical protein
VEVVVEGVVEELDDDVVVVGTCEPSPAPHPASRQAATAAVTMVLPCMAETLHHVVDRAPQPSSHPVRPLGGGMPHPDADPHLSAGSSERAKSLVGSGDQASRTGAGPIVDQWVVRARAPLAAIVREGDG